METYPVQTIYVELLVKGYTVDSVSDISDDSYLVVMRNGFSVKSVILRPKGQLGYVYAN